MIGIYFAGSIRGGRELAAHYNELIGMLRAHGKVFTEHVGDDDLIQAEQALTDREIYERDMAWIRESDIVVAEVSVPSLGVGYEIGVALSLEKPVLCIHKRGSGRPLSAMIAGNPDLNLIEYDSVSELKPVLVKSVRGTAD